MTPERLAEIEICHRGRAVGAVAELAEEVRRLRAVLEWTLARAERFDDPPLITKYINEVLGRPPPV